MRAWCADQDPDVTKEEVDELIADFERADKTSEDG